jgi:hypothetical protein
MKFQEHDGTNSDSVRFKGKWKIKDGGHLPEEDMESRVSQLLDQTATKFQRLRPCFRDPATQWDQCGYCTMHREVENQRWRPLTGSGYDMIYPSLYNDSNENLTAISMFWVSV